MTDVMTHRNLSEDILVEIRFLESGLVKGAGRDLAISMACILEPWIDQGLENLYNH